MEKKDVKKTWKTGRTGATNPGLQEKVQEAIEEDPTIQDSSKISVTCTKGGLFKKAKIHLIGKVNSEKDRQRAEEIAVTNSGKTEVVNEILVEKNNQG